MNSISAKNGTAPLLLATLGTLTLLVIAYVRSGALSALAVVVGEVSALVSVLGLVALGRILQSGGAAPKGGTGWLMLVGLFKLPFVLGGLYLASRLAGPEPAPLVIAVILVYSCFVWFVARTRG
ncbi:MAG: hypothetical protein ACYC96_00485 [Fimbriimonadaceae bacterium]